MHATGLIRELELKHLFKSVPTVEPPGTRSITLTHLQGIFLMAIAGIAFGFFALLAERGLFKSKPLSKI